MAGVKWVAASWALLAASVWQIEGARLFPNWESLQAAEHSTHFVGRLSDMPRQAHYHNRHPRISEELLFIQSNTRLVSGQDARGDLRFLALPTRTYPVPTGLEGVNPEIGYGAGMFEGFDFVRGPPLAYQIQLQGQEAPSSLVSEGSENQTYYAAHFLPLTRAMFQGLEVMITSYAPVSDDPGTAPLAPAPLPGPPGLYYVLRIRNTGNSAVAGSVFLNVPAELDGRTAEAIQNGSTLILSGPQGALGVELRLGRWEPEGEKVYRARRRIELAPGEEVILETRVAMGRFADILPTILELYMRPALDRLNATAGFWRERLGSLSVSAADAGRESELSRDVYIRCVLDNFCCLQTDAGGKMVSFFQGVPREGTIWGIDYEPTLVSLLPVVPELVRSGIEFVAARNRPPRSPYPEHSPAILVAPVIISRKWLETTGDLSLFQEPATLMQRFERIFADLGRLRSPAHDLYAARYSSDGPVGRRYDHGTNAKIAYAFDSYAYLLDALGRPDEARQHREASRAVTGAMTRLMVTEGPFGSQLSGGTNLGEEPGEFYLPEDLPYYDGEDTGTHLAPVYGLYDFNFGPWVNVHRWARSVFCPNFEPEMGALRWGWKYSPVTGTGFVSRLAGSVSRSEMRQSLEVLAAHGADVTGSIFWWPIAADYKRGLARCSQGQGSWAWQYLEQWLGLRVDALSRTLSFGPRGLPTRIDWDGLTLGPATFDVSWSETSDGASVRIVNRNSQPWKVRIGLRPFGTGAETQLDWHEFSVAGGESLARGLQRSPAPQTVVGAGQVIAKTEARELAVDGVVFKRHGTVDPLPEGYQLWEDEHLDFRFFIRNASGVDWAETRVDLVCPSGWFVEPRPSGSWPMPGNWAESRAAAAIGSLAPLEASVAAFRVRGPHRYAVEELTRRKSWHYPTQAGTTVRLPSRDVRDVEECECRAELAATGPGGEAWTRRLSLPVRIEPIKQPE